MKVANISLQDKTLPLSIADPSSPGSAEHNSMEPYNELRRLIIQNGLLERQPAYFAGKIVVNSVLWIIGLALLATVHPIWQQLIVACYLAFVSTQIGFLVHDAGHLHISKVLWKNALVGLIYTNFVLGMSHAWWVTKHNLHHSKPNQSEVDPDVDFIFLAVSEQDAQAKKGFLRFLVNYQAYFFFPFLLLEIFSLKIESWQFLWRERAQHRLAEAVLLALHYIAYGFFLIYFLGVGRAITITIIYNALFGLFLGMVFATNHLGKPLLPRNSDADFTTRQVVTARNLKAHWLTDYCFGVLGCQIEHHLFTGIPRSKLRAAQRIVRPFCEKLGIDYHETGVAECYREVLRYLESVSKISRTRSTEKPMAKPGQISKP